MVCTELCGYTGCENVDPDELNGIESDGISDEDHEWHAKDVMYHIFSISSII